MIDTDPHKPNELNYDSTWDIIDREIADQCSFALLDYEVLASNIWKILICGGGIKICFLRERVTDAFKPPIHQERFYSISVIFYRT